MEGFESGYDVSTCYPCCQADVCGDDDDFESGDNDDDIESSDGGEKKK